MNRSELQSEVIKKVMNDAAFRDEILKSPKEAISKAFNMTIPAGMKIELVEEDADTISLVLPKITNELSDGELDAVSAGGCFVNCFCKFDFL